MSWGNSSITNQLNSLTNATTTFANLMTALALRPDGKLATSSGAILHTNAVAIAPVGSFTSTYYVLGINSRATVSGIGASLGSLTNIYAISQDSESTSIDRIFSDGTFSGFSLGGEMAVDLTNVVDSTGPVSGRSFRVWLKADGTVGSSTVTAPSGLSNVVMIASGGAHALALTRDGTVVGWGADTNSANVPPGLSNVVSITAAPGHSSALLSNGTAIAWGIVGTNIPSGLTNVADLFPYGAIVGDTPPSIVSQSPNVYAWSGEPAMFRVKATGSHPLYYQWQANGTNIPNATNFFYRIAQSASSDPASFQVVVSNRFGVALSRPVSMEVHDGPPIMSTLQSTGKSSGVGQPTYFFQNIGAKLDGSEPITYRWFHDGTEFFALRSFISITNATLAQSGNYWLVASNAFGVRTSGVYTVGNVAAEISQEPSDISANWGARTNLSVGVIGEGPFTHQWYLNNQPIPTGTSAVLPLNYLTLHDEGFYKVVVANAYNSVTSRVAHVTVEVPTGPIFAWGHASSEETLVPPGLSNVTTVVAGDGFSVALNSDGTVTGWGSNDAGQLTIPAGLSNVTTIAAGRKHVLALKADGTIVAWGDNSYGQTDIPSGLSSLVGIAAGDSHSLGLLENGTVVAWGRNDYGQTNVPPGLGDVVAISAGSTHCLALKRDGSVIGWGSNIQGETTLPSSLTNAVAIAGGNKASIVLLPNGNVLGFGTVIAPGLSNLTSITASLQTNGDFGGIRSDGTAVIWNGATIKAAPPGLSNAVTLALGATHKLAFTSSTFAGPTITLTNSQKSVSSFTIPTTTIRGWQYYLEFKNALGEPWTLQPPTPGNGSVRMLSDSNPTPNQRFYRVRQKP